MIKYIILLILLKVSYDISYTKSTIKYRNGDILVKKQSITTSILIYFIYIKNMLGTNNFLINNLVQLNTTYARKKWTTEFKAPHELHKFGKQMQIQTEPWIWQKSYNNYTCVNDFFIRKYNKTSDIHPKKFFKKGSKYTLHSPAESKIIAFNSINESKQFWIKNNKFTLKKTGLPNYQDYLNHPIIIFRLEMYDYHRYHAPVSGKIIFFERIGANSSHSVQPAALHNKWFNVFNTNKRVIMILETRKGLIALMFVGAVQVDSITFNKNIRVGHRLTKGKDMGTFQFGGSTVVLFSNFNIKIDADIIENSKKKQEYQVNCGEMIGCL